MIQYKYFNKYLKNTENCKIVNDKGNFSKFL